MSWFGRAGVLRLPLFTWHVASCIGSTMRRQAIPTLCNLCRTNQHDYCDEPAVCAKLVLSKVDVQGDAVADDQFKHGNGDQPGACRGLSVDGEDLSCKHCHA